MVMFDTKKMELALTKLNYNARLFADGVPITLKFADSVGEVLTAGPVAPDVPLPFMYYIRLADSYGDWSMQPIA